MFETSDLEGLAKQLTDILPESLGELKKDLQKNFHSILQSGLAKLNLVTREEFDAQVRVLQRTRGKLESLERQIETLTR